ncbi:MAG: TetR/AcrR family transcriptional regulator [Lachnospiraceae bacterium]|nr:TetR/AcrR family transcriptional regulator [Lachnospiraceae bacterium]
MPPKAKITKEMIVDTAFNIMRKEGADKVTVRSISEQLNCSTQPVLYYFSTIQDIKKMVYKKADEYHSAYIMDTENDYGNPMLAIGMNYIRFAIEERNIFQLLFQSNEFSGAGMLDLLESGELLPMFTVLQNELDMTMEDTKEVFSTLFIFVHGYASLYANNTMLYDESNVMKALEKIFYGAVCAVKGEQDEKGI